MRGIRGVSARVSLTASYVGLVAVAGAILLGVVWFFLLRYVPTRAISTDTGWAPNQGDLLRAFVPAAAWAMAVLLIVGAVGGWFLAGRMLAPLRRLTEATRHADAGNLALRVGMTRRDEFGELADSFDGMLERIEAHVAEQQRFAANASHELRTPLAITRTLLEVARSDPDRDTAALLERLARVNDRSIELVEALLLLSRVERRAFERRDVDLSLLLEEAAEALLPLAEERGAELLVSSAPAPTSGSEPLLGQVAVNLLHNALVHGDPTRGPVSASTWLDEGEAVLVVESAGAILDPASVETLVEPFHRGVTRTRREGQEGAGLGLAIVAAIVHAHDGTLHLTARPSGGLRVVVRLAEG